MKGRRREELLYGRPRLEPLESEVEVGEEENVAEAGGVLMTEVIAGITTCGRAAWQ